MLALDTKKYQRSNLKYIEPEDYSAISETLEVQMRNHTNQIENTTPVELISWFLSMFLIIYFSSGICFEIFKISSFVTFYSCHKRNASASTFKLWEIRRDIMLDTL